MKGRGPRGQGGLAAKWTAAPFHPFLTTAFPILSLYAANVNRTSFGPALGVLVVSLGVAGAVFITLWILTRDRNRSACLTTFFGFLFFSYGRLFDAVPGIRIAGAVIGRNKYLIPVYALAALGGTLWIFRSRLYRRAEGRIIVALNIFGLGLVVTAGLAAAMGYDWKTGGAPPVPGALSPAATAARPGGGRGAGGQDPPDVYYLVFDSYASARVLRTYYQWNDDAFIDELRKRGFAVAENAFSNYPFTNLSVSSTLNMRYIHEEDGFRAAKSKSLYLRKSIETNAAMAYFRNKGYDTVLPELWKTSTRPEWAAGLPTDWAELKTSGFSAMVIHTSFLRVIEKELLADVLRGEILTEIRDLRRLGKSARPRFLYAHVICPHPPYIFRADGSKPNLLESAWGRVENTGGYVQQVRFIGRQILDIVDSIRRRDERAVIILQGDHGHGDVLGLHLLNRGEPPRDFLKAQFGILSAVSLPPGMTMPAARTPVNLFRNLIAGLFDEPPDPLPDRAFFTPIKEPFQFRDVTAVAEASE